MRLTLLLFVTGALAVRWPENGHNRYDQGRNWALPGSGFPSYTGGAPTITADDGVIAGVATNVPDTAQPNVNKFLGLPFAVTPPERFSPPEPASKIQGVLNATAVKPACIQQFQCEYRWCILEHRN